MFVSGLKITSENWLVSWLTIPEDPWTAYYDEMFTDKIVAKFQGLHVPQQICEYFIKIAGV